jgi:lactoylglutathione lyase
MAKAIHMMVRVLDLDRSITFYRQAFALEIADRVEFDSFTLVYLRNAEADFEVELTLNHDRDKPYELGDGYGHIAFCVDDLEAEHRRFTEAGLSPNPIRQLEHKSGLRARFFFVSDPDGYKIEVLQRQGRYR